MPKATKIVVQFDDGSTWEVDPATVKSIFTSQAAASSYGQNPPYHNPPQSGGAAPLMATATGSGSTMTATADAAAAEGTCYLINGVVICF